MEPTRQVVRHTMAIGASGSPAVLAEMMTYLGYRWHPEYTVYEEYQDFNQEQYRAIVHLYSREYDSTTVLHTSHGVGVTIDMAVHDAAYAALTRLRGEYRELDTSPFRHIAIASDVGTEGYYTAAYSTVTREPFYHQHLVLHADGLDRANRALRHEMYTTRQHLYRALTLLHPFVRSGQVPRTAIYPARTVMPHGVGWPEVGGYSPALGPLLPPERRALHLSIRGPQSADVEGYPLPHYQLSGYSYLHSTSWD